MGFTVFLGKINMRFYKVVILKLYLFMLFWFSFYSFIPPLIIASKFEFNTSGNDMFKMLELQMLGKIDSWAIRWCYNQFKQRKYTIYPTKSKLVNIGFDSKGTHNSRGFGRWSVEVSNEDVIFESIEPDNKILECFKKYYDLKLITKIGYMLKKTGGYKIAKKLLNRVSK